MKEYIGSLVAVGKPTNTPGVLTQFRRKGRRKIEALVVWEKYPMTDKLGPYNAWFSTDVLFFVKDEKGNIKRINQKVETPIQKLWRKIKSLF
jgi:hypothetical protein